MCGERMKGMENIPLESALCGASCCIRLFERLLLVPGGVTLFFENTSYDGRIKSKMHHAMYYKMGYYILCAYSSPVLLRLPDEDEATRSFRERNSYCFQQKRRMKKACTFL